MCCQVSRYFVRIVVSHAKDVQALSVAPQARTHYREIRGNSLRSRGGHEGVESGFPTPRVKFLVTQSRAEIPQGSMLDIVCLDGRPESSLESRGGESVYGNQKRRLPPRGGRFPDLCRTM